MFIRDEGAGRPLVMIHGWSCPGRFFQGQVEAFRSRARCIVPDLPGHGETGDRLPRSIEAGADAIQAYLEAHDLTDVVLCGWSMGASTAYSLVERHGAERISSVVAIDMTPKVLNGDAWTNGMLNGLTAEYNVNALEAIVTEWASAPGRIAAQLFAADLPVDPELMAFAVKEIGKQDPVFLKAMWASLTNQDFRSFLPEFPVPLHLAAGLRSQLYGPGVHRWYEENVPGVHLHPFENSGHSPHLEEPEKFNGLLMELVGR